jgi:hypothetical protein
VPLTGSSGHAVDVIAEIYVVADPALVRDEVCSPATWRSWFPGISLVSYDDRGRLGERWRVCGELLGTAEIWLEEHGDGTVVHAYLRADPRTGGRPGGDDQARVLRRRLLEVKDRLEGDRVPGTARVPLGERVVSASKDGPADRRPRPWRTSSEGAPDGRSDHVEHPDRG